MDYLEKKDPTLKFEKKPVDNSPLSSNAWLAGFFDGGFQVQNYLETPHRKLHLFPTFGGEKERSRKAKQLVLANLTMI